MADKKVPALCGLKSVPELTNPVIISDVHLAANKPKTIMAFLRFMKNVAPRFAELVILGDLFDYWLGDDATPEADPIIAELKLYSSTGRRVLIMQGSHDALLGADFAESCGAELIADQIVISVNGNPILFAYGDQCTISTSYFINKNSLFCIAHFQCFVFAQTLFSIQIILRMQ